MNASYIYLLSSLPMLHFGMKPPFTFERFINICSTIVPAEDLEILRHIPEAKINIAKYPPVPLMRRLENFEAALRNELVKLRASRKHVDAEKYLREGVSFELEIAQAANRAVRNPSPLEAERELDLQRWNILEQESFGHYFDSDALVIYGYKLLILERWERILLTDKQKILEQALSGTTG